MNYKKIISSKFFLPLFILLIWFLADRFFLINRLFFPTFKDFFITLILNITDRSYYIDIGFTFLRTLTAFIISALLGTGIGLIMGYYDFIYKSWEFIIDFFRSVPATALIPLFLLIFGLSNAGIISLSIFSGTLIIIINSVYGVKHSSKLRILAVKLMHSSKLNLFSKVILPSALPHIFVGFRQAISITLIIVVVSEMMLGTSYGLGYKIIHYQLIYKIPQMYNYIFTVGVLGFTLNKVFVLIENRFIHWVGK